VISEPTQVAELRGFSHYPELVEPAPLKAEDQASNAGQPSRTESAGQNNGTLPDKLVALLSTDLPDDLSVIEARGSYMDDVWRRLRSSRAYRPLHFSAWQQNRVDYYPPMRIHDETILDTRLDSPAGLMIADLTADDPLAEYRHHFYQLDGSAQLRRSRFLHIYLDLEYRKKTVPVTPEPDFFRPANLTDLEDQPPAENPGYAVHSLKQNRQVRSGQLQYFDSPYFGVLVFVTSIKADE